MRAALIAYDVALPGERGLGRMYYLAELFARSGYDTELITSDFQHWEKRFRTGEEMALARRSAPFAITFVKQLGYTKNIQLRRVISYRVMARHICRHLDQNDYDLVYCLIPDNHIAAIAGRYARRRSIPFIVDVEDLWPEAMRMVLDVPVVSDILFSGFAADARRAYRAADGVVGSSDRYRDEPLLYHAEIPLRETVYVGNELAVFDAGAAENVPAVQKPENEFWVSYAGTLGTSYDIPTLIRAADILCRDGNGTLRVMLLGDGPMRAEFEALAKRLSGRVSFLGYMPYPLMAAYLRASDVTVNSLIKKASQGIVSKIGDYLAAGRPMINTGLDEEFRAKVEADGFGLNVPPEDAQALADAVSALQDDPALRARMGENARRIAEEQFDRPVAYRRIIAMADRLTGRSDGRDNG